MRSTTRWVVQHYFYIFHRCFLIINCNKSAHEGRNCTSHCFTPSCLWIYRYADKAILLYYILKPESDECRHHILMSSTFVLLLWCIQAEPEAKSKSNVIASNVNSEKRQCWHWWRGNLALWVWACLPGERIKNKMELWGDFSTSRTDVDKIVGASLLIKEKPHNIWKKDVIIMN